MSQMLPLSGHRIAVTRAREQAPELAGKLIALGAEVVELPLIRISKQIEKDPLADVMLELGGYDWIVFTSANGVRFFMEEFVRLFDDIRSLGLLRFACIGDTTAAAIRGFHLRIECQPKIATAEALAEDLVATGSLDSAKVLVITGNLNRDVLVPRPAGRYVFGRLIGRQGARLQILPLGAGAKQQIFDDPAWIAVATRLIRAL